MAGFKVLGRGVAAYILSQFIPVRAPRSRFGRLQQLHWPRAVSLGITTILKNCFRMFTRPLCRFWSRGNPISATVAPSLPLSIPLHRCLDVFDANRLRLYTNTETEILLPSAEFQIAT